MTEKSLKKQQGGLNGNWEAFKVDGTSGLYCFYFMYVK